MRLITKVRLLPLPVLIAGGVSAAIVGAAALNMASEARHEQALTTFPANATLSDGLEPGTDVPELKIIPELVVAEPYDQSGDQNAP